MLVKITNCCRMGCSHCMDDAKPDGKHMSKETFSKALDLCKLDGVAMITGGEPTEHPDLLEFIRMAKARGLLPVLMSNGMFVELPVLTTKLLEEDILIQVTNDAQYYPKQVKKIEHERVTYIDKLSCLTPLGRAKGMEPSGRIGPPCFNLRNLLTATRDFEESIKALRSFNKFCTPSVDAEGNVRAGESTECFVLGTVWDSFDRLTQGALEHSCQRCGLTNGGLEAEVRRSRGRHENTPAG